MNILIITPDYPDKKRSVYTFVKQVAEQFVIQGHNCCVLAPYSITKNKSFYKKVIVEDVQGVGLITVLRPNHISLSNLSLCGFSPSTFFRNWAIKRALKKVPFNIDVVYAHFWRSGIEIYPFAKSKGLPLFVASGESQIPQGDINPRFSDFYDYVSGVICVSTKNMEESIGNGMATKEKCIVLPNAVNNHLFRLKDRALCRKQLNLPQDIFIVAFCGAFIHRKGVGVLSRALDSIDDKPVYSLFIGRPLEELPTCKNILSKGPISHNEIPTYLNAADIFVLPTLKEGCCNAIIEAMACGLPVVSSDRSFNWDVLNSNNSILVDPEDSKQVADSIIKLRDNIEYRMGLSEGALIMAKELTIEKRVNRIIDFIRSKIY